MATKNITVKMLIQMFYSGAENIESQKEYINDLNVFPVPDGDTGTNMSLTMMSASQEVSALENPDMNSLAKAISSGSLRGARGNSGVILSQLLRGFSKVLREETVIDVPVLTKALQRAKETAYKAVMKPKEGTILTVASGIADRATELAEQTDDLEVFLPEIVKRAEVVLDSTPDLLPVLKEAGVVDSGGQGLVAILQGAYDAFLGKEVDYSVASSSASSSSSVTPSVVTNTENIETSDIKFGYCTEYLILTETEMTDNEVQEFRQYLSTIGDSIVCVADEAVVKVHVHTNDPGLAIQKGLTYGELSKMKIDNMREEHHERIIKDSERLAAEQAQEEREKAQTKEQPEERKAMGFITVSMGSGLKEIFTELGVDYIIEGGQTMNPSTEDLLNAIEQVSADTVFILPNNKNIIMAANQAKDLTKDKQIIVIPTETIPQGITAVISFSPEADEKANETEMLQQISGVKSGNVTYAIRDTKYEDKDIHEGDIMGIGDDGILSVTSDVNETTKEMLKILVDDTSELISLYYGNDVTKEDAEQLTKEIEKSYPDIDVDMHYGGQPLYYYVLAVE